MGCPMLLPAPPRLPCSQFDTLRWAPGPRPDPGLDLLPNTLAQPSTAAPGLPRQAADRPRPVNSIFSGAGGSRGQAQGPSGVLETPGAWGLPLPSLAAIWARMAFPHPKVLGSVYSKGLDGTQRWTRCGVSGSQAGGRGGGART